MSRLPLRLRLALVFGAAMAAVLAAAGAFLYVRLGDSLEEQLHESLAARAQAVVATFRDGAGLAGDEEEFAQVLGADGDVVAASPGFGGEALISSAERARAPVILARPDARLLAVPAGSRTVVVGGSLEDRDEALAGLLAQLLVGGPAALVLASLAGYLLAGAALRPVEAMRRRAGEISSETPGSRLPLPLARDEIHRLGSTLNAMLDRLDAGLRRERRFVADASHELRTPLASLQAELELALRRPRSGEELEYALRSAAEEVDRLVRLSEALLVLATDDEAGLPLRRTRFAARSLLEEVAGRFAGVEVGAAEAGELEGDRLRLGQALGNLVDNGLRHGALPVLLDASADGSSVVFSVADAGPGFPPDFLAHAFERFSRGDDARTTAGAGLGLALVAAVARAHGGEPFARNSPGGGAETGMVIPAE